MLERRPYQTHPERYEYRLTQKGLDLFPVLMALTAWGDRYLAGDEGPPLAVSHRTSGRPAVASVICSGCGEPLTARETRSQWREDTAT